MAIIRTELTDHDKRLAFAAAHKIKITPYREIWMYAGAEAKRHWADSMVLGIVTMREDGFTCTSEWLTELTREVYKNLGLLEVE